MGWVDEPVDRNGTLHQQCLRKTNFYSRRRAKHMAKRIKHRDGIQIDVYHCRWCDCWHLTRRGGHRGESQTTASEPGPGTAG
jgi:hypothetical protein